MRVLIFKKSNLIKITVCLVLVIMAVVYGLTYSEDTASVFSENGLCLTSAPMADNAVALTFDTCFGEDQTEQILGILDRYGVKATFCVMGVWAEENSGTVKKIADAGHEIISHSMTHERYEDLGVEGAVMDAVSAREYLKLDHGVETNMIRTPYGGGGDSVYTSLIEEGFVPVGWSLDSQDWRGDGAQNILMRVLDNAKNGDIIVMQNNNIMTVEALPQMIEGLNALNLECVTLRELTEGTL